MNAKKRKPKSKPLVVLPKVGILHSGTEEANRQAVAALVTSMSEAGYVDGDDIEIVYGWGKDDPQILATEAANLAGQADMKVIIAAGGTASAAAAQAATNSIPIVFTSVTDPVAAGFVISLDEPGTNMTGMAGLTSELDPKRLELLKEFLANPASTKIGVLTNNTRRKFAEQIAALKDAAQALGLTLEEKNASRPNEINAAISSFSAGATGVKAILVTADPLFNSQRKRVVRAVKARTPQVPAIYQWRESVVDGGLMSYGPSIIDAYRQAGAYAAKVIDGKKPRDLPVLLPDSYELVINLKTANKMGFRIPVSMLTRAVLLRRKA